MDIKIKILVAGDVRGRFKQLFQRVESINKKAGPFEILFCVGSFFSEDAKQNEELIAYKNGCKHIPVPTYILGPNSKSTEQYYENIKDGEICSNLTYLGKRGIYTLSSGVKVAYLSGVEAPTGSTTTAPTDDCYFNQEDIAALRNSCLVTKTLSCDYKGVDILLTAQWPAGISASTNPKEEVQNSSKLISFLCKEIKPRYHFCGFNGKYHEAPPFRIPADQITQLELCTRFISLADVGNESKEKYIYALSLTPVDKMRVLDLIQKTTNEVNCPFVKLDLSACSVSGENSDSKQYFFDMHTSGASNRKRACEGGMHQNRRHKIQHIEQEKCWFCLSSPDVEKHLVISIGENFYLALAKGPINEYHVLILSITHIPAAALLSEDVWTELEKYKTALRNFFQAQGQVVCFTERHYKSSHLQINAFGIDKGYAWKIQHAFEDKAEEFNLQFEVLPVLSSSQMLPQQGPYFIAELPNDTSMITRQVKHFPLHFARDVFCSENLLNCDEKVNWKDCKLDEDEEIAMVQNFRKKFVQYDFTVL